MVARSSTEAEYRALASAVTDLVWIQNLLAEIDINLPAQPLFFGVITLELKPWLAIQFFMP